MTNPDGTAIVKQVEQAVSAEILPQSDTRLLTQQDVAGLSLREINYAKNEIYARHGRKFASKELQDYFNAQSWYQGTVDAADFQESSLSDIEKKNAEFLAEVEFSIAPVSYTHLSPVKSVGNSCTAPHDLKCDEDAKMLITALGESVAMRLREQGLLARTVCISIRDCELYSYCLLYTSRCV